MFRKILVANRGEIAVRVIRACRDLGIPPVAVYSEADRDALHVKLADEAYCIGPPPSAESYLRIDKVVQAARDSGAEAIHPGYGFLAENPKLAQACIDHDLVFIGPPPSSIALMGDKIASRKAVREAGVPTIPGSEEPVLSAEQAVSVASEIGFPVMIKASAGGGGKGMRTVAKADDLERAFRAASGEAQTYFGDSTIYLERFVHNPRHIEVQVLADSFGNLIHLGERECSIQRRHQKLLEECPSPVLDEPFRDRLGQAALTVAAAAGYRNAGTVEFLVDTSGPKEAWTFYFLEMNTRLQVEHPVTELVTGIDLVREQILIARGEQLGYRQKDVQMLGSAIECRIYAEDPSLDFIPSPGRITTLFEPSGPGIRNESGVYEGFVIPIDYDPLISKLVAYGENRSQAIQRMRRALREYKIGGVTTTIHFFEKLLSHPDFLAGRLYTNFISDHGLAVPEQVGEAAVPLVAAALEKFFEEKGKVSSRLSQRSRWKDSARRYWS